MDQDHDQVPLSTFVHSQVKAGGIVYEWSKKRAEQHIFVDLESNETRVLKNNNIKAFSNKPTISLNMMIDACNYTNENDKMSFMEVDDIEPFFIYSKDGVITNKMADKYINAIEKCEWSTFVLLSQN